VVAILFLGWRAFRMFQSGSIAVFDTGGPISLIKRHERPLAFWSFVALFYSVLLAIAVAAAALPFSE
jgi:hypothetical protein